MKVDYAKIILAVLMVYLSVTIIIRELPLILFALCGLLVYKYRDPIKKQLKKLDKHG